MFKKVIIAQYFKIKVNFKDLPTSRPEWRLEQDIDPKLIVEFHRKRMEHEQMIIKNLQRRMVR